MPTAAAFMEVWAWAHSLLKTQQCVLTAYRTRAIICDTTEDLV